MLDYLNLFYLKSLSGKGRKEERREHQDGESGEKRGRMMTVERMTDPVLKTSYCSITRRIPACSVDIVIFKRC